MRAPTGPIPKPAPCDPWHHDWRQTDEGGWKPSFERADDDGTPRPAVPVVVVYCGRCGACVDIPVDIAGLARLPESAEGAYATHLRDCKECVRNKLCDVGRALWEACPPF